MARTTNSRYVIIAHTKKYIEHGFQKKKQLMKELHNVKYYRSSFFEELGKFCGVEASTISQIHTRNLTPSHIVAIKLSEYLEVNVNDLLEIVEKNNL